MRKLVAAVLVAAAALVAGPGQAADMPYYPPDVPEVDYGLEGSFYLRGSLAGNLMWSREVRYDDPCLCTVIVNPITDLGFGYSVGGGFGYETGDGFRGDVTLDYLHNSGLSEGTYTLTLRSTIGLANAYYDFGFSGYGSAAGGFGTYVGAGIGAAFNSVSVTGSPDPGPDGQTWAPVGALMTGVTYDMGTLVADLGYRMLYMPQITNGQAASAPATPYYINDNFIHELRGTMRYRFN